MTEEAHWGDWFENVMAVNTGADYGVFVNDTPDQNGCLYALMDDGELLWINPDNCAGADPEMVRIDDPEAYKRLVHHIAEYTAREE